MKQIDGSCSRLLKAAGQAEALSVFSKSNLYRLGGKGSRKTLRKNPIIKGRDNLWGIRWWGWVDLLWILWILLEEEINCLHFMWTETQFKAGRKLEISWTLVYGRSNKKGWKEGKQNNYYKGCSFRTQENASGKSWSNFEPLPCFQSDEKCMEQSDEKRMEQEFHTMTLTCLVCADHSRWNAWISCPNWIGGHHSEFIFYPGV